MAAVKLNKKKMSNKDSAKRKDAFYVQSLERAFIILDKIAAAQGKGINLTDLSKSTKLHPSTVYRLLQNLEKWNYVTLNPGGNYVLGFKFLEMGAVVQEHIELTKIARKYMEHLNEITHETIYLAVLDEVQGNIIYIDKIPGRRNVTLAAGIGTRNYVHSTANGKCLLSGLSDDKIMQLLKKKGMPKLAKNTITDIDNFLEEIRKVREYGYAIDDIENEDAVRCVSAPIYDYRGCVVAAMSISGVETHISVDKMHNEYKELIVDTASKISHELGYRKQRPE